MGNELKTQVAAIGDMTRSLDPFQFVLIAVSGWMNQQQLQLIHYLREEN